MGEPLIFRGLRGKLWYLQHSCVGQCSQLPIHVLSDGIMAWFIGSFHFSEIVTQTDQLNFSIEVWQWCYVLTHWPLGGREMPQHLTDH